MNEEERDAVLNQTRDMVVRMHEALIVAKIPQRVAGLEQTRAEARGGWKLFVLSGALGGFILKLFDWAGGRH